jgi:uncharacterized protein YbjT (DUF2867 family)
MVNEQTMKVLIFGASGMVGQGVLRVCLHDDAVSEVLVIGRTALAQQHAKMRMIVRDDLLEFNGLGAELATVDACFYCLGVSSTGLDESAYTRITFDLTLAAARALALAHPGACFTYVSGAGTDSSERGRSMWARVKGRTENALLALPLKAVMFRPGAIAPLHGEVSKTPSYRLFYTVLGPLLSRLKPYFPGFITSTEQLGRAMLAVARHGSAKPVLESTDIEKLG